MDKGIAHRGLAKADDYLADLLVPRFKVDLDAEPSLEFANLMDADRKALEEFLSVYGGYKAYLESQVADEEPKKTSGGTTITGVQLLVGIIFVPVVMVWLALGARIIWSATGNPETLDSIEGLLTALAGLSLPVAAG